MQLAGPRSSQHSYGIIHAEPNSWLTQSVPDQRDFSKLSSHLGRILSIKLINIDCLLKLTIKKLPKFFYFKPHVKELFSQSPPQQPSAPLQQWGRFSGNGCCLFQILAQWYFCLWPVWENEYILMAFLGFAPVFCCVDADSRGCKLHCNRAINGAFHQTPSLNVSKSTWLPVPPA